MKSSKTIVIILIIISLLSLGSGGYFYYQYQKKTALQTNPEAIQKAAQEETKRWVEEVGKVAVLPSDETPTIATVSDINKLKDQPFFKNAENGDKVLLYTKAKKAYLYDPNLHKIVDIGPINIGTQANPASSAKIAIRNGTDIAGLASNAETDIEKAFPGSNVVSKEQAKKTNYDKTIVVAFNDQAKSSAEILAKFFNTSVGSLPAGEDKPEGADILVILGKDRTESGDKVSSTPSPTKTPTPTPEKK